MSGETRRDRVREGKTGRKGADGDCLGAEDEGCGRRWRRTGGGEVRPAGCGVERGRREGRRPRVECIEDRGSGSGAGWMGKRQWIDGLDRWENEEGGSGMEIDGWDSSPRF